MRNDSDLDNKAYERPRSSHGSPLTKKLDLLYPETDLNPNQVRIDELLKYCEEIGVDE